MKVRAGLCSAFSMHCKEVAKSVVQLLDAGLNGVCQLLLELQSIAQQMYLQMF